MTITSFLNKLSQIIEGWWNTIFKTTRTEMIASARYKICQSCAYMDTTGKDCFIPGTQPCCGACGCSLAAKIRSMQSSCPKGKWPSVEDSNHNNMILGV
jgi:hypothetical protein